MTFPSPQTSWPDRLRDAIPAIAGQSPALQAIAESATWILHGSTTRGVEDAVSDLDLWCLPPTDQPPLFVEFLLEGKKGHVQIESRQAFEHCVLRCDFPLIFELRHAIILQERGDWGTALLAQARRTMPPAVRAAWFAYHYIEMRSEHRACDNPICRGDATALLLAMTPAISHALQAAMVLDGEPYPYSKWLAHAAARTPTGKLIAPLVEQLIDDLGSGALRRPGPEREHPLNLRLREIRRVLIDAARASGIDTPWLNFWYLHLHERSAIQRVTWNRK